MKMLIFTIIYGLLMMGVLNADDEQLTPKLLVSKQIMNKFAVQDLDLIIKYTLYNIGTGPALNIRLADKTYPKEFQVIAGDLEIVIDKIAPQTNVSHTVVIRPSAPGLFNFTSAIVKYKSSENSEDLFCYSSGLGEWYIVSNMDYIKKFSPHLLDWTAFTFMTLPCLLMPFMLWYTSKSKYELISKQKKEKSKD